MKRDRWFPKELIDRLQANCDLESLVPTIKLNDSSMARCPSANHEDVKPSWQWNKVEGYGYCHGCGANDTIFGLLEKYGGAESFQEAVRTIARNKSIDLSVYEKDVQPSDDPPILKTLSWAQAHFQTQYKASSKAQEYLTQRGFIDSTIESFGLGYCPGRSHLKTFIAKALEKGFSEQDLVMAGLCNGGKLAQTLTFSDRIIFPLKDSVGQVRGFTARAIDKTLKLKTVKIFPKYINSKVSSVFSKKKMLYGLWLAKDGIKSKKKALLVEGPFDVLRLWQAGVRTAVSPLGARINEEQLKYLWSFSEEIAVMMDSDTAGLQAVTQCLHKSLPLRQAGKTMTVIKLPWGNDPDEYFLRGNSFPSGDDISSTEDFLWNELTKGFKRETATAEEWIALESKIDLAIKPIVSKVVKHNYRNSLRKRFFSLRSNYSKTSLSEMTKPQIDHHNDERNRLIACLVNQPSLIDENLLNIDTQREVVDVFLGWDREGDVEEYVRTTYIGELLDSNCYLKLEEKQDFKKQVDNMLSHCLLKRLEAEYLRLIKSINMFSQESKSATWDKVNCLREEITTLNNISIR